MQKQAAVFSAAVTTAASNVGMALAGGQSEGASSSLIQAAPPRRSPRAGMGLPLGIDDSRESTVLALVFGVFFLTYYNWAKDQPDRSASSSSSSLHPFSRLLPPLVTLPPRSDSDFFGEYDERRK